ncbi:MAG TPA: peptidylprolyl isomerase [Thermoanaerobaculia bacterium]|jgi:cyclophilin family peptidyl-prolyl cis-trans isomerase|nr:peptidylprolyl isomerase [Thermoanaerobaculia bacterium]
MLIVLADAMRIRRLPALVLVALLWACASGGGVRDRALLYPDAPEINRQAPDRFRVRLETSKGLVMLEIHREWAPHGVDRLYNLVRCGYYDEARFFRVIQGKWAQFGIHGDPRVSALWRGRTIPDDPRRESNRRGMVAYAFAVPNGRTTQVFINLRDNSGTLDAQGFAPFGRVVEGMDVVDALNAEYAETAGGGIRGGKQEPLFAGGNEYLAREFPRLDFIRRARIVE